MADLRISDLVTASQLKDDDYYEIAQSESGTRVSYKTTLLAIAVQIATMVDFTSDLNTTSKKITGAINELKQLISLIPQFSIEVVQVLPTEDISDTTIYLVPAEDPEVGNYYEEYIHVNDAWELVGTTAVDLSAYYTKLEVDGLLADKLEADDFEANQTASANPITLETKQAGLAKSCVVSFGPIQDLHGYSNPWIGGAGKNKLIYPYKSGTKTDHDVTFTVNSDGTVNLSGTSSGYAEFVFQSRLDGTLTLPAGSYILSGGINYDIYLSVANSSGTNLGYDRGSGLTFTLDTEQAISVWIGIGGNINTDGKKINPMVRLSTVTDATFAPYENICPISGRTETNILQGTNSTNIYKDTGVIPFNSSSTGVEFHGDNSLRVYVKTIGLYQSSRQYLSNYSNLVNGKKYAIFADVEIKSGIALIGVRNSANSVISDQGAPMTTSGTFMCTFTMSSEASFLSFFCTWDTQNINADVKYTNIRFVEYEKLITKEYGQTVYGGKFDFDSGKLLIDTAIHTTSSATEITTIGAGISIFRIAKSNFSDGLFPTSGRSISKLYCEKFKPTTEIVAGGCYIDDSGLTLRTVDNYESASDFLTNIGDIKFTYPLATSLEIQLSPEAVTLLKGLNVIRTDGDKVQVEFSDIPVGDYSTLLDYIKSLEDRIKALEG